MIKTSLKTLVGSCLLGMALSVQAAPSLDVGEVTSAVQGTVNVPVAFNPGGDAIVGLQFDIDFTNSEVTPAEQGLDGTGMVPAGAGGHPVVFSKIQTSPNTIRVVLADFDNPLAGGVGNDHNLAASTIIDIPFTLNLAGAVAADVYALAISNIVYSDAAGVAVAGAASDSGTITVTDSIACDADENGIIQTNDLFSMLGILQSGAPDNDSSTSCDGVTAPGTTQTNDLFFLLGIL